MLKNVEIVGFLVRHCRANTVIAFHTNHQESICARKANIAPSNSHVVFDFKHSLHWECYADILDGGGGKNERIAPLELFDILE